MQYDLKMEQTRISFKIRFCKRAGQKTDNRKNTEAAAMAMAPIQNVNSVALVGTMTSLAKNILNKFSIIINYLF